jgi:hypothetical protein
MTDADTVLMQRIKSSWHAEIEAAIDGTIIPEAFLGALIANESAGNAKAERFEPVVFAQLAEVLLGTRMEYNGLTKAALLVYIERSDFTDSLRNLAELATSRNLTQIMGWHFPALSEPMPGETLLAAIYLNMTVKLLTIAANDFELDLSKDFPQLLRCWNTGRPDGKTYDPQYVPNALKRMAIYGTLP